MPVFMPPEGAGAAAGVAVAVAVALADAADSGAPLADCTAVELDADCARAAAAPANTSASVSSGGTERRIAAVNFTISACSAIFAPSLQKTLAQSPARGRRAGGHLRKTQQHRHAQ